MGREVRRVPPDWQHPKDPHTGHYVPLHDGADLMRRTAAWDEAEEQWARGLRRSYTGEGWEPIDPKYQHLPFAEYDGARPDPANYMPVWAPEQATHLMMYEDTSEGTPISPAFATPEELARWLADNNASAFADLTASYAAWLRMIQAGWAPSAVGMGGRFMSGVEAAHALDAAHAPEVPTTPKETT